MIPLAEGRVPGECTGLNRDRCMHTKKGKFIMALSS